MTIAFTIVATLLTVFIGMYWWGGRLQAVQVTNSDPAPICLNLQEQAAEWIVDDPEPIPVTDTPDEDSVPSEAITDTATARSATHTPTDVSTEGSSDDHTKLIGDTISRYGASAKVVRLGHGATVTRYQLTPIGSTKVAQLTSLSNELTVACGVPVRVAMEDATVIAETVNETRGNVGFVPDRTDTLTINVGTDAVGGPVSMDIAKLPHLLVAGTTGSGKSGFLNTVLCGLLMKNPDVVRLHLVDPKFVEFAAYETAAHVETVVNEPIDAIEFLADMCEMMDLRYMEMKQLGIRDFDTYRAETGKPYHVVVIDEFADLIDQDKTVVNQVKRLGQKARACGIHLIIATQKPSHDVIPKPITDNLPGRVAFQVAKSDASRVILGENGAEKLAGKGDGIMHTTQGKGRFQSAWLSDDDIEQIVSSTWG